MAYRYQQNPPRGARPGDILMVVHDFDARSTDELTLRRGDRIELVELDDGFGDGWYLGKHLGREGNGLFPGVYTAIIAGNPPPKPSVNETSNPNRGTVAIPSSQSISSAPVNGDAQEALARTPTSPTSAQEITPQPSRQPSMVSPTRPDLATASTAPLPTQPDNKRSSSSTTASASIPNIQRSISETIGASANGQDSPVMNETLSVIDEHIKENSTPRHSFVANEQHIANDSASEYSSHLDNRLSYVQGPETDDEDNGKLTEKEVKKWDYKQTAQYLRNIGVDARHCEIFEEQEISGDVLLDMDRDFIYMKEYDFGVMGKRLKTWHKIRAIQEEVKGSNVSRKSASNQSGYDGSSEDLDRTQSRLGQTSTLLPRIPSLMEKSGPAYRQSRQQTPPGMYESPSGKRSSQAPLNIQTSHKSNNGGPLSPRQSGQDSPSRPSAASIRDANHARRHSSMDVPAASPAVDSLGRATALSGKTLGSHQKQPSFDRNWSMSSAVPTLNNSGTPPLGSLNQALRQDVNTSNPNLLSSQNAQVDLDRGYFSGGEIDNRKARNVLRKRDSATGSAIHSRQSSFVDDPRRSSMAMRRHSRFGSADSIRDIVPMVTSPAAKAYHSNSYIGRFRSASAKSPSTSTTMSGTTSPTVTNLEGYEASSPNSFLLSHNPDSGGSSPLPSFTSKMSAAKARRIVGLRAISDAVTGHEKDLVSSPNSLPSPIKEDGVRSPSRTGSSTPSAASKSIDNDTTDVSSKGTDGPLAMPPPKAPIRGKTKSKKETSAYTRGLVKKTPAEQRIGCDYSGWMRKKSSSLVTMWKPRLFILKGRRLSYYYSEDDPEERGVIDISSHKVLVADQDPITTFHATITGSASTPATPQNAKTPATTDEKSPGAPARKGSESPFFFKLVPPKAGLPRAVQFTRPTIHYFQVDNISQGRKWMGELMKATIEHTLDLGLETTNKQKTITLAKARARKERPPALKADDGPVVEGPKSDETGLNIRNLSFDHGPEDDLQNGFFGHKKQGSLDAVGAYMAQEAANAAYDDTADARAAS